MQPSAPSSTCPTCKSPMKRASFVASGEVGQFDVLKPWLMGDPEGLTQAEAAAQLGMTGGAVKVAIHRLRQKFGEAIPSEIADTVDTEEEIAGELRYLIEVLKFRSESPNGRFEVIDRSQFSGILGPL